MPFKYASRVLSVVSGSNICSLDKAKLWAGYARSGRHGKPGPVEPGFSRQRVVLPTSHVEQSAWWCVCTCTWAASHHYLLSKGHHGCPPTITSWPSVEVIRQGNVTQDYLQENLFWFLIQTINNAYRVMCQGVVGNMAMVECNHLNGFVRMAGWLVVRIPRGKTQTFTQGGPGRGHEGARSG